MEELVLRAKVILSEMFKINICHFEKHISRKVNVIEARRFLIFFLREEMEITYEEILRYCPAIKNHATAIYHFNTLSNYILVEPSTKKKYDLFHDRMVDCPNNFIEKQIMEMTNERKKINNQLYKLKKLL